MVHWLSSPLFPSSLACPTMVTFAFFVLLLLHKRYIFLLQIFSSFSVPKYFHPFPSPQFFSSSIYYPPFPSPSFFSSAKNIFTFSNYSNVRLFYFNLRWAQLYVCLVLINVLFSGDWSPASCWLLSSSSAWEQLPSLLRWRSASRRWGQSVSTSARD